MSDEVNQKNIKAERVAGRDNVDIEEIHNHYNAPVTQNFNGPVLNNGITPDELAQLLKAAAKILDANNIQSKYQEKYQAFVLFFAASIHKIDEKRQKFIFDCGELGKNRFSVYLSDDNALILRVIDSNGDFYSLRASPDQLQFDQFSFFQFEAANVKGSSFLRFFVNGSQLQILELNHPLPVTELLKNMNSYVYFKDLENQKPASFRLASNGIFPETFTPTQQNAVVKAFAQFEQEMATP